MSGRDTSEWRWYVLDINPMQWVIGPIQRRAKGAFVGRNQELYHYQQAVKEALNTGTAEVELLSSQVELRCYFWRRLDPYLTPQARTHRTHEADLTNLVKAVEDAIQGVLLTNDKNVRAQRNVIVEQSATAKPAVVIAIRSWSDGWAGFEEDEIPDHVWDRLAEMQGEQHQLTLDPEDDSYTFLGPR